MSNHSSIKSITHLNQGLAAGFIDSCKKHPTKNALVVNDVAYTYAELMQLVKEIYSSIESEQKHERIAVYCTHDVFSYATILAVAMYGACYVPLNIKFPTERNSDCIKSSGVTLVLSTTELPEYGAIVKVCKIDTTSNSKEIEIKEIAKQDLAYILFTSGSTGVPKGVAISKSNVNHFFNYFLSEYDFTSGDNFLQPYELTFDVSVFSMFMPWLVGGCCYEVPQNGIRYMNILATLKKHPVTVSTMVPGVLKYVEKYLSELNLPDIRYSFFSGDALYHDLAVKWKKAIPNGVIHNFYGPTETTIVCTRYVWNEKRSEEESLHNVVPLGISFPGTDHLIVDENNILVKEGEPGELCFTGVQTIEHYLNNTNADLFFTHNNEVYYKTGDVASVNKYGNLIFHGRKDAQVKINGYRVELGEIEEKIKQLTKVDCCAICLKDKNSMNYIAVVIADKNVNTTQLKEKLSSLLPEYMIPQRFQAIDQMPLNVNGKVDKQKLIALLNGE